MDLLGMCYAIPMGSLCIRHGITMYDTILYYTILYCTILYYTILYYTIRCLYYTILYNTYTTPHYTILYYNYTTLYYTIPKHVSRGGDPAHRKQEIQTLCLCYAMFDETCICADFVTLCTYMLYMHIYAHI